MAGHQSGLRHGCAGWDRRGVSGDTSSVSCSFASGSSVSTALDLVQRELKHLGLWKFAGAMMYVQHEALGLSEEKMIAPMDEKRGKLLLAEILNGGNLEETPYSHLPYSDFGDSMIDDKQQMKKKVFVSGCYDLLHSGHVEFFQQASRYGDLYVGIGSDATYLEYKHRKPMFPQEERLFMVKNIKAVKDAYINEGSGVIDFLPTLNKVKAQEDTGSRRLSGSGSKGQS